VDADIAAIVETFRGEAEENLRAIEDGMILLESRPEDEDTIAEVFRHAHTLKGNALSLGFAAVSEMANAVEEVLEALRRKKLIATASRTSLLLEAVDALRELLADVAREVDEIGPRHRAIMDRLAHADAATAAHDGGRAARHGGAAADGSRTVRVDIAKLDRLLRIAGELAVQRRRSHDAIVGGVGTNELLANHEEAEHLHSELHDVVLGLRMVPVGGLFRRLARSVRDLASSHGKRVRVVLEGDQEEIDASLVDQVRDPLTHMIRNAIDHGVEREEDRRAAGKDATGTITLRARRVSGAIEISLSDDGRGLRREAIVARAESIGIIDARALSEDEIHALIFRPGFSTATEVSELSGRGVGMDVVKRNIEGVRGAVRVESREGQGTTVTLRLPLTVAMIEGFVVAAGSETYVLPMDAVRDCSDPTASLPGGAIGVTDVRGHAMPFVRLRDLFRVEGARADREAIVVVEHGARSVALVVDHALGSGPVVLNPVGRLLAARRALAGSTVLASGRVAFVLDVGGVLDAAAQKRLRRAEGAVA
jgi:two-component system chemotaxis sensor kinase CheA